MEKIIVKIREKSYPIIIGYSLCSSDSSFWPFSVGDRVLCVTNDYIAPLYLDWLNKILKNRGVVVDCIVLPDGEESKNLVVLNIVFDKLLSKNYDRNAILVAFGGGVIGDLTGFAAATYQRGIRFIQVPTTLLAQVDAAIGGKTGVNHLLGKNMIGAFYQPIAVVIDLDFLRTLSVREFSSGLSEVIKYAIAFDSVFFNWLEEHIDDLLSLDYPSLMYCVRRCCEIKASVVSIDERDYGVRCLLNFGHTYGHAIESCLGYREWSHGEAVAAGIMMAVNTAIRLNNFSINDAERIRSLLLRANLPVCGPKGMVVSDYFKYMIRDKKSRLEEFNLILPVSIGKVKKFLGVDCDLVSLSIQDSYCK